MYYIYIYIDTFLNFIELLKINHLYLNYYYKCGYMWYYILSSPSRIHLTILITIVDICNSYGYIEYIIVIIT